jgi:predicted ABC-type ATPase
MAHLYIIRGLPGSGKTTFGKALRGFSLVQATREADSFFIKEDGSYVFEPKRLSEAHKWCQSQVFRLLKHYTDEDSIDVAVCNTFTQLWEMQPYIDYCKQNGHTFTVVTCEGNYGNVHGVPEKAIERMKQRWERYEG